MATQTIVRIPRTWKSGKNFLLEVTEWDFCDDIWGEIKSYLFTNCCKTCSIQTDDLTCIPSAIAHTDGRFEINSIWLCRACALDPKRDNSSNIAPHKNHYGSTEDVVKKITCRFEGGGSTRFYEWITSKSNLTLPGRFHQQIQQKVQQRLKLVKPKGMRWDTWNWIIDDSTEDENSFRSVNFDLGFTCCKKTGVLMDKNLEKWIKKYFVEQKEYAKQRL